MSTISAQPSPGFLALAGDPTADEAAAPAVAVPSGPREADHPLPQADAEPLEDRIVVGVDGSDASLEALRRGALIATALGAGLDAIATWRNPTGYAGMVETYSPEHNAELILDQAIAAVFGTDPPLWLTAHTIEGNADQVLIDQSRGAQMLIAGSRGHGGLAGVVLGSVSAACAEHAHCPVLIMH